jgi:hypothetical protein
MHGKHSRVVFIPLYRNMVCNNGIDSRKCATGLIENPEDVERLINSRGYEKRPKPWLDINSR